MHDRPLILHIVPTLSLGGAERIVVELAARLPEEGFRTKLIVLFGGGPLADELRRRDVRWTQILPSASGSRFELISRLRAILREDPPRGPAIIHTHLFGADFYGAIAVRRWSVGHRLSVADFHSGQKSGARSQQPLLISTAHNIDRDDSSLRRIARRWAARRMDKVIAVSGAVARYAKRNLRVREHRIEVISNGIDTSAIPSRGARPFHAVPKLLAVGRLEAQKGHAMLFDALAKVPAPWQLDIAGSGSLERDLRERAERLGIASRVRFLGERHDIGALLADADLFCFPSLWEGMGLALVEAMSAGVPVLASDLLVTRELAPASRLVALSAEAWSEAIRMTLAHSEQAIAQAARQEGEIRQRYGIETMIERYAELYRNMIAS